MADDSYPITFDPKAAENITKAAEGWGSPYLRTELPVVHRVHCLARSAAELVMCCHLTEDEDEGETESMVLTFPYSFVEDLTLGFEDLDDDAKKEMGERIEARILLHAQTIVSAEWN